MANNSDTLLTLALCTSFGLGACDQADSGEAMTQDNSFRVGSLHHGGRRTENTGKARGSATRDIGEFWDDGRSYLSSTGYETTLVSVSIPDPADPDTRITTMLGDSPAPGQARVELVGQSNELAVNVYDTTGEVTELTGAELVDLELKVSITDRYDAVYDSILRINAHADDPVAGDLFELLRVDPSSGTTNPVCETSDAGGRFARITDGLGIDYDDGAITHIDPGLRHIGCCASAPAKAITLGYDHHLVGIATFTAATRAIRADYCADGYPYTFHGNAIRIFDNLGDPASDPNADLATVIADLDEGEWLEAVWDEEGVLCLGAPRAADVTASDIVCPTKGFDDGTLAHNWAPPRCEDFVDANPNGGLRIYTVATPPL